MPWNPDTERDPESAPESAPEGAVAEDSGPSDKSPDSERDNFDDAPLRSANDDELVLDLDGFEGPIDILLTLARDQKVDLRKISILELADQYLAFIARARRLRLEIAADYLVMAAWLAYLKSRLLLPEPPADGEPSGADLAAALAFQLQRLEAMQEAGKNMMALPQFGRDFFARGAPEPVKVIDIPVWDVTLFDLLKAYGTHPGRRREGMLRIAPLNLFSMDDALKRIGDMLGHVLDWTVLKAFLPEGMETPLQRRSALAATFAATLELARSGNIELRQEGVFSPIYLRRAIRRDEPDATELQQG